MQGCRKPEKSEMHQITSDWCASFEHQTVLNILSTYPFGQSFNRFAPRPVGFKLKTVAENLENFEMHRMTLTLP